MTTDPYVMPGTHTLVNQFGLSKATDLENAERAYTSIRAAAWHHDPATGTFDFEHLKAIHQSLFQDIFAWAGQPRTVNISKGDALFAPVDHMTSFANSVFKGLKKEANLVGLGKNEFLERAGFYLGEINAIHPFREGNGRTQREFIQQLAQQNGYAFNWSKLNQQEMIQASIHAMQVDASQLQQLLEVAWVEQPKPQDPDLAFDNVIGNLALEGFILTDAEQDRVICTITGALPVHEAIVDIQENGVNLGNAE